MATSYSPQTEALMQRLRPGAAPSSAASPFARGGQVKQLPGAGTAGKIGDIAGGVGVQIAGQQVGRGAAEAAAKGVATGGVKSALTSGAGGAAAGMGIGIGTDLLAQKLRTKEDMPTFGGANSEYLDDKGRRFQGTGGGINSNAIKYAGMVANPALTASTMGLNLAAGAAFGAIKGAVTKHAPSAYTDYRVEDGAQAIKDIYQKELGREASDDEVMTHLKNVGFDPAGGDRWAGEKSTNFILDQIRASPEAQAFKAGGGQAAPAAGAPGAAPADPLGAGGGDPFSTGTQKMRAMLAAPSGQPTATTDLESRANPGAGLGDLTGGNTGVTGGGAPNSGQAATVTDTSAWDTDGYSAPAYTPPQAGPVPDGWDATKWNNPNHQTPKYGVGRILSNFPPTVEGLTNAFPEIEKAYPGATFDGKDKLTLPGVGTIDVLKGASKGGEAWRWDDGSGGEAAPADGGQPAGAGLIDASGGASNQGDVAALIQQLMGREGQSSSGGLTQALMNQLRQTA